MLGSAAARTHSLQSPRRARSGEAAHAACSMPLLVRSMRVCQSVMDRQCLVLVAWSGAGPTRPPWCAPSPWGPQAHPGVPAPPTPLGGLDVLCVRSPARWGYMRTYDSAPWSASPDKYGVWLCCHQRQRGVGQAGVRTLYASGGCVPTLVVSWDTPPCGRIIEAPTLSLRGVSHEINTSY